MGWPRRLTTAASLLTGALVAAGAVLAVQAPSFGVALTLAISVMIALPSAGIALLITRRAPDNLVGLWLGLIGLATAMVTTKEIGYRFLAERPRLLDELDWLVAAVFENAWWIFVGVALLLLHFPSGRLPSRRWRWAPPVLLLCALLQQWSNAYDTGPFRAPLEDLARPWGRPPAVLETASLLAFFIMLVLVPACALSLGRRWRRGTLMERRQITWLALAGIGVPLYPLLCLLEIAILGHPFWFSAAVGIAGLIGMPIATGIAVLKHDLYDVDKGLAVTVTWAVVTVGLLSVYAASSFTAGMLLGRDSPVAAASVTALCALGLTPLRTRLQDQVDRRLYPLRPAAFAAIDQLHREAGTGQGRPEELERALRHALRDPLLRVGFRVPGTTGFVDANQARVDDGGGTVIELTGEAIGIIVPGSGMASPDLLRQIARRATTLTEVVRLRLELANALREVESSRARLVQRGYEERRQLERDLHDGAQQRLVSLGMAIRLAQRHLDDGSVNVGHLLDQSVAELGTAVAELRQIARGLRPTSLDDGLPAALAGLVRTVPVVVDMDVCADRIPDDVATTAYFVVSEAIANAVKHAEASLIKLRVTRIDGHVVVTVTDDGQGGASLHPKSGIADRVAALGGHLQVVSPAGRGTVVEAALPCAS